MSLWLSSDEKYCLVIDYYFRTCCVKKDNHIPNDVKNIIRQYLYNRNIKYFTDNYANFYIDVDDIFPNVSESTLKIFDLYPKHITKIKQFKYEVFPFRSRNADIKFCDSQGKQIFALTFADANDHRLNKIRSLLAKEHICQACLSTLFPSLTHDRLEEYIDKIKRIIVSPQFKALCKQNNIKCTIIEKQREFFIGFSKFSSELALFLYEKLNKDDNYNVVDYGDNAQVKGELENIQMKRVAYFTFIDEMPLESDMNNDHLLVLNKSKLNGNNFSLSKFITDELKLDYTLIKKIHIIDKNKIKRRNMKDDKYNQNYDTVEGRFSIEVCINEEYYFGFGHHYNESNFGIDNNCIQFVYCFEESLDECNKIFYQIGLLLIETFEMHLVAESSDEIDTKLTKEILQDSANYNYWIDAKVLNDNYNQNVKSQKEFNVMLNIFDKLSKVLASDEITECQVTIEMNLEVVYP